LKQASRWSGPAGKTALIIEKLFNRETFQKEAFAVTAKCRGEVKFKVIRAGDTAYLQAPLFTQSGLVDHAFSTRLGGCSDGPLSSLNTAYHTGDREENVIRNRRRFFNLFNYDYRDLVSAVQVHGTDLDVVKLSRRGEGALPGTARRECDALVTTEPGLPLGAYSADCQLIYFISKQRPLAALAHAGWKGTLGGIGPKVVSFLQDQYRVSPDQILAALSPAICPDCYKVDEKTAGLFQSAGWNRTPYLEPAAAGSYKLDIGAINFAQLLAGGIKPENINRSRLCTSCRSDLFYSYRRDRGNTGRMIGFIALKDQTGGRVL